MGKTLEEQKAARAAKLQARIRELGRDMTSDEIFAFADNCCIADSVANLGAVSLMVAPPTATAMPIDTPVVEHDLDII